MNAIKRISTLGVIVLLLLSLTACKAPVDMSRQELCEDVADMIEDRGMIPEEYLACFDGEMAAALGKYNALTLTLTEHDTDYATRVAESKAKELPYNWLMIKYGMFSQNGRSLIYYYFIDEVSHLALYPNASKAIYENPLLDLFVEHAGSGGTWAWFIQDYPVQSEEIIQQLEDYFVLVDELLVELGAK